MAREAQSRTCEWLRASSDQFSQNTTHKSTGRGIILATLLCKEKEIPFFFLISAGPVVLQFLKTLWPFCGTNIYLMIKHIRYIYVIVKHIRCSLFFLYHYYRNPFKWKTLLGWIKQDFISIQSSSLYCSIQNFNPTDHLNSLFYSSWLASEVMREHLHQFQATFLWEGFLYHFFRCKAFIYVRIFFVSFFFP